MVAPTFTGTDNCEGTIEPVVTTSGPSNTGCAYTQTWNANYTDVCGNPATQQSITYTWTVDNTAPVISTTATSGDLGCNPTVVAPTFTGTDNCEGTIEPVVTTSGPSNTGCAYTQTWNANYTDVCGNPATQQSITYTWTVDNTAPVISTTATSGDLGCNPTVVAPTFTGTDNCEGTIEPVVTTSGPSNTGCAYTQTWNANYTDVCGNPATQQSITYTWTVDNTAPVISTTATSGDLGCNPTVVAPTFTGTDNCEGTIEPVVTTSGPSNTGCAYTQTWNANYTDVCGNPATQQSITYTWTVDNTAPVINNCPAPVITFYTGASRTSCDQVATWTEPTANDNCNGAMTYTSRSHAPGDIFPIGTTTVTYVFTDGCNNSSTCTFNVVVVDNTAPVVSGCPTGVSVNTGVGRTTCDQTATWTEPTATDNCHEGALAYFSRSHAPGDVFPVGSTTVTYVFRDAAGNETPCSFNVVVTDNTAPIITCPANIDACSSLTSSQIGNATATDNCGTVTVTNDAPSTFTVGTTIVTWTAKDAAGNTSTCTQTVTIEPVPTISFTATTTNGSVGSTSNGTPSTVTINLCSGSSFTFSGYSSVPGTRVGAIEQLTSSGNVRYNGNLVPANRPATNIAPASMASFFSATYGPYTLVAGHNSGTITQTYTPYIDLNTNGVFDNGECLGQPITLQYNVTALPTFSFDITGTPSHVANINNGTADVIEASTVAVCNGGTYTVSNLLHSNPVANRYAITVSSSGGGLLFNGAPTGNQDISATQFNGAQTTYTVTLVNPSTGGTVVQTIMPYNDFNGNNQLDPTECTGDPITITYIAYPRPALQTTVNTVQVTNNNNGADDTGSFTVCHSTSDNLSFTQFIDMVGVTPSANVKVILRSHPYQRNLRPCRWSTSIKCFRNTFLP